MKNPNQLDTPEIYRIRIKGLLDEQWSEWFDGFSITPQPKNESILEGPISDQGALHGVLAKIRDLGLTILSMHAIDH